MKSQYKKGKRKIWVGLSGGVDSAVSAALLKEQGYNVTGVFIKAWTPPGYPCTWREDRWSAMRAAAVLDIPFITLDLEKEYKEGVVDYMIEEYRKGRTPNPDVMCNKEIKFGEFLKFALNHGADYVATGHYARNKLLSMNYVLCEAKDKNKDQSYFLWTLTQEQLKYVLFPVGNLQKTEVRRLAKKFYLPQATRKDSQGLCFLGQVDMKEFLTKFLHPQKGKVLDEKGEEIGEHDGAILFTLGERHGFRVWNKDSESKPLYVVAKDITKNIITVTDDTKHLERSFQMLREEIELINPNLNSEISTNENIECRFRYRQEKINCKVVQGRKKVMVKFDKPQLIAPGQSIVFYIGEICLGGGIIA